MGNYVTSSEIKAYKVNGEVVDLIAYTDGEIDAKIALSEELIETITGDWFYSKSVTQNYDGNGLYELFFSPEIPAQCLSLTSVENIDSDGTVLETYVEDEDFERYEHYLRMIKYGRGNDSARQALFYGGKIPKGENNIKVVGNFGRSTVPAAIKEAASLLTLESLQTGSSGLFGNDVSQAVWSDFTITYRGERDANSGIGTGFAAVDRLLAPYMNYSSMFLVVPNHATLHDRDSY